MSFCPAMKIQLISLLSLFSLGCLAQKTTSRIQLISDESHKKVDVVIDGKLFTSYIYPGPAVLKKPVLYPVLSAGGNFITRGWPLNPRPGERVDHPHHVGLWFNYGDVNGHDFWNNSTEIAKEHKGPFGTIVHTGIKTIKAGNERGELIVTADWLDAANQPLLQETTQYIFGGRGKERSIDRITTLRALTKAVVFRDNKEGMVALRVARQLEQPSTKPELFTDANGVATPVPMLDNDGVTGQYRSSEGLEGDAVWGTRASWMNLTGTLNDETVSVTLLDHPKNLGYPTYWHARGYGLYAANPLAPSVFTDGKAPALNYRLQPGQAITFRYRLLITSERLPDDVLNQKAHLFSTLH